VGVWAIAGVDLTGLIEAMGVGFVFIVGLRGEVLELLYC
jgi:hypothetical protein